MKQHAWKLGLIALNLCVAQSGWAQARFELELAGGFGSAFKEVEWNSSYPVVPIFSARAAVDMLEHASVGVRPWVVAGPAMTRHLPLDDWSAYRALAVILDARLHGSGPIQFWFGGGAGVGRLYSLQLSGDSTDHDPIEGGFSLAVQLSVGIRALAARQLWIGLELNGTRFTGAHSVRNPYLPMPSHLTELEVNTWAVLLSIGFSPWR
jgi:hypothetical protein